MLPQMPHIRVYIPHRCSSLNYRYFEKNKSSTQATCRRKVLEFGNMESKRKPMSLFLRAFAQCFLIRAYRTCAYMLYLKMCLIEMFQFLILNTLQICTVLYDNVSTLTYQWITIMCECLCKCECLSSQMFIYMSGYLSLSIFI